MPAFPHNNDFFLGSWVLPSCWVLINKVTVFSTYPSSKGYVIAAPSHLFAGFLSLPRAALFGALFPRMHSAVSCLRSVRSEGGATNPLWKVHPFFVRPAESDRLYFFGAHFGAP